MGTSLLNHLLTLTVIWLVSPVSAFADTVVDPLRMEGQSFCADGQCFERKTLFSNPVYRDLGSVADLIQKTYMYDKDGKDPRETIPRDGKFAPIGEMYSIGKTFDDQEFKSRATAFWISPCLLLTNYHAVVPEGCTAVGVKSIFTTGHFFCTKWSHRIEQQLVNFHSRNTQEVLILIETDLHHSVFSDE